MHTQRALSAPDAAVTRVAVQSVEAALTYVTALPLGSTLAVMTKKDDGSKTFWLAAKHAKVEVATQTDVGKGIKRGERVLPIIWYDRMTTYKFAKLDEITQCSVAAVVVTVSRIAWQRTTANRYYLGDHTHGKLMELVNNISEVE